MIEIMAEKIKSLSKRLQLLKLIHQKEYTKEKIYCCTSGSEKSLLEESMQQVIWESG